MKKLILLMLITISMASQSIAVELSFQNPTLTYGVDKRVGAIYKFSNVTTGIDALVKIVKFNNGARLENIDTTSVGLNEAFQPILKSGYNNDSSIEFEISFVEHGSLTPKFISLNATGADIDGNGGEVLEYIILSTPKSYSLETPTRLTATQDSDGLFVIPVDSYDVPGITVTETRNIVTASYENVSKINYTVGAKNAHGLKRLNSLYFKDVSFNNPKTEVLDESNETLTLTGTLRDFYDWSQDNSKNPDFENTSLLHGLVTGLVKNNLNSEKKPIFKSSYGSNSQPSITNATTFSQWFKDVEGINRSMPYQLTLKKQGDIYVYDSDVTPVGDTSGRYKGFFPLDDLLFGNEGNPHNYHFTFQLNSQFTYRGGEIFTFSGDDDVWVFIDNRLVVDVGGIHARVEKSINLDDLGLTKGNVYDFNFFFAERHRTGSNLKITTSIKLENISKPVLSITDSEVIEGDSGNKNLKFTVTLDKEAGAGVSFKYQLFDGNNPDDNLNANDDDYEKNDFKTTVTLEGTSKGIEIKVPIKGDTILEKNEQFRILLSDIEGATFGNDSAIGTILDDDGAIGCTQDAWIVKDNSSLFKMDIVNKSEEEFKNVIKYTNALGYNETDGYLWGYNIEDRDGTLVRIGKTFEGSYTSKTFGPIDGLPTGLSIFIGDVDSHGHLYILDRNHSNAGLTAEKDMVYVIDLNSSSDRYMTLIDSYELRDYNRGIPTIGKGLAIVDWAFHPKNGKLYSVSRDGRFYEIDPNTHVVKESKSIKGLDDSTSYETFFDENGYLYLYGKKLGKVFRLDLTDPNNPPTEAVVFATNLGKSDGGDAARCAKAPMGDKPIITLKESVLEAEGNSGTTSIIFQMHSDRVLDTSFDVNYDVTNGTAKIDDDFVKTSGTVECQVVVGSKIANCQLPIVRGDLIKEADEIFNISFTSDAVVFINGENSTTGTIINDDSNSFTAYDIGNSDRKIRTKIVGKDFNLTLARLDSTGALTSFGDENSTKVRIIDSSLCGHFSGDMSGFVDIDIQGVSTIQSPIFNISNAIKRAKVQFFWIDEDDVNQTVCSNDSFSIRPDKYTLSLSSSDIKSGEDFNLTIEAKDANNNVVQNYEEPFAVYALTTTETKAFKGCALGTLQSVNQTNFVQGVSVLTLNYKDIGKLKFVVNEINSSVSEYAYIDASDGSADDRFITKGTITHKIEPAKIQALFSFKTKNSKNYTYFSSDPQKMGAIIDANITMLNNDNNPVTNFSSTCWANDVDIAINFSQLDGTVATPMFKDANGTAMANILSSSKLNYKMSKGKFTAGKASREILMNFGRSVKDAKAPIKIKLSSPKVSLSTLAKDVTLEKSIDFVYARAHAPKVQSIVDKNMQAVVGYEVYIPKTVDKSLYGFSGLKVSEDFGDWYILPNDSTFGFATGFTPFARFTGVNIESFTSNSIVLKSTKTPHKNRIFFTPHEYLMYNQFNANAKVDSFQVNFYNKKNTWLGKGKQGIILDDKASKQGLKKMDW